MMQTWADYLDELKAGQGRKVLPFTVNEQRRPRQPDPGPSLLNYLPFFLGRVSTTVVFGRRLASFTGMKRPFFASRPILFAIVTSPCVPGDFIGLQQRIWHASEVFSATLLARLCLLSVRMPPHLTRQDIRRNKGHLNGTQMTFFLWNQVHKKMFHAP